MKQRLGRTALWLLAGIGAAGGAGFLGGWAVSGELRTAGIMMLLYLLVSGFVFPWLVAPAAHLAARWLGARGRGWTLLASAGLAFPAWIFLLTRVDGFDYGYNPLVHPVDWVSALPLLAGTALVMLGCRADAMRPGAA